MKSIDDALASVRRKALAAGAEADKAHDIGRPDLAEEPEARYLSLCHEEDEIKRAAAIRGYFPPKYWGTTKQVADEEEAKRD